jgi:hypothetical protein
VDNAQLSVLLPVTPQEEAVIALYLDAIWMEKGLSKNSLESYRTDLTLFAQWLASQGLGLLQVDAQAVLVIQSINCPFPFLCARFLPPSIARGGNCGKSGGNRQKPKAATFVTEIFNGT